MHRRGAALVPAPQAGCQGAGPHRAGGVGVQGGDAHPGRFDARARAPRGARVPGDDADLGADPQGAVGAVVQGAHNVELVVGGLGRVDAEMLKGLGALRQVIEAARPGGHPQAAVGIQRQRVDVVGAEAAGVFGVVGVAHHRAAGAVDVLQAAPGGHPHAGGAVADDGLDDALARRPRRQRQRREVAGARIEAGQAVLRAGPHPALAIFEQRRHAVVGQAVGGARVVGELDGLVAVVAVQAAAMGADPDKSLAVLHHRQDRQIVGVERAEALETQFRGRHGRCHGRRYKQAQGGKQAQRGTKAKGKQGRHRYPGKAGGDACGRCNRNNNTVPPGMFHVNNLAPPRTTHVAYRLRGKHNILTSTERAVSRSPIYSTGKLGYRDGSVKRR